MCKGTFEIYKGIDQLEEIIFGYDLALLTSLEPERQCIILLSVPFEEVAHRRHASPKYRDQIGMLTLRSKNWLESFELYLHDLMFFTLEQRIVCCFEINFSF